MTQTTKSLRKDWHLWLTLAFSLSIWAYWSDNGQRLPATKYLDLKLLLFWWIEKNGHLTSPQQADELFNYIEKRLLCTSSYQSLQRRALSLDTKVDGGRMVQPEAPRPVHYIVPAISHRQWLSVSSFTATLPFLCFSRVLS